MHDFELIYGSDDKNECMPQADRFLFDLQVEGRNLSVFLPFPVLATNLRYIIR